MMLNYTKLASDKHTSLFGPFVSYKGNEVLYKRYLMQVCIKLSIKIMKKYTSNKDKLIFLHTLEFHEYV